MKMRLEVCELDQRINPTTVIVGDDIVVTGTSGNDSLYVNTNNTTAVIVVENGVRTVLALPPNGHIIMYGLNGRDSLTLVGQVSGEMYGGNERDTMTGGSGADVIQGCSGNDQINGGTGHDVLIGGMGTDTITGGSGDDILIGGSVLGYDYDMLRQASDDWANFGLTDPGLVAATTDTEMDRLTGGTTADWFIVNATDYLTDATVPPDVITIV